MYLNLDLLCCEDSDCSRAIAECKRMRKADSWALVAWVVSFFAAFAMIMLCALLKIDDTLPSIAFFIVPAAVPAIIMLRAGTLGITTSIWMKLWTIIAVVGIIPYIGWCFAGIGGLMLIFGIIVSFLFFGIYPLIDILDLSIKLSELNQRNAAFERAMVDDEPAQSQSRIPPQAAPQNADLTPNFFAGCSTFEQVRTRYMALCKAYHPDTGNGDTETLQTINSQYEGLIAQYHG